MNRRDFFSWFRAAPIALPVMASAAAAGDGVSFDGKSFTLDGVTVLSVEPDGAVTVGPDKCLKICAGAKPLSGII
jgi:hypothetical protein